jgi:hypothetical protein
MASGIHRDESATRMFPRLPTFYLTASASLLPTLNLTVFFAGIFIDFPVW